MVNSTSKSSSKKSASAKSAPKAAKKSTSTAASKTAPKSAPKASAPKASKKVVPFSPILGFILVLVCAIIIAFLFALAALDFSRNGHFANKTDAAKIAEEYSTLTSDNVFYYASEEEVLNLLNHGTGIVFLSDPSCPWCQFYIRKLDMAAKDFPDQKIAYYDISQDRKENTEFYRSLVNRLSDYLQFDNVGQKRIYIPNVTFVKNGNIILNDWETSKDTLDAETPEEYWTEERIEAWYDRIRPAFEDLQSSDCEDSCNK